jgi:hypothetical protein
MLDMSEGQDCFLSQSQWRQLLQKPAAFPVSRGPPSLSLRSKLCNLLVDGPDLLQEAAKLIDLEASGSYDPLELQKQRYDVFVRASSMKRSIEGWYLNEFQPSLLVFRSLANDYSKVSLPSDLESNHGHISRYPEVLFGVLDCVSNTVLVKLDQLLLSLTAGSSGKHDDLSFVIDPDLTATRQETIHDSFAFVSRKVRVAAKPLEFGLQQIWSIGHVFYPDQLSGI